MTQSTPAITQEQVENVRQKLQALYDGLPADEKPVLAAILRQAAQIVEVSGYDLDSPDFFNILFILEVVSSSGGNEGQNVILPVHTSHAVGHIAPGSSSVQSGPIISTGR